MFKKNRRRLPNLRFNIRHKNGSNNNNSSNNNLESLQTYDDGIGETNSSLLVSSSHNNGAPTTREGGELAAFDACVEACDALAASSTSLIYGKKNTRNGNSDESSSEKDECDFQLSDCFVRVSPDGELMFLPVQIGGASSLLDDDDEESEEEKVAPESNDRNDEDRDVEGSADMEIKKDHIGKEEASSEMNAKGGKFTLAHISHTEYQSAVVVGNDQQPGADRLANGFSANGWSSEAAGEALRQSSVSLQYTSDFLERLLQSRTESASQIRQACDSIVDAIVNTPKSSTISQNNTSNNEKQGMIRKFISSQTVSSSFDSETISQPGLGFQKTFPSLNSAIVAMERYHSVTSENEIDQWKNASLPLKDQQQFLDGHSYYKMITTGKSCLSKIQSAAQKTSHRALKRETALQTAEQLAYDAEQNLQSLKRESRVRWDAVHEAEALSRDKINQAIQARRESHARGRERKRMEKEKQFMNQNGDAMNGKSLKAPTDSVDVPTPPTQEEIWEMVSQVTDSFDQGSFAPTIVPSTIPVKNDMASPPINEPKPPVTLTPMEQMQIEYNCNIPRLRSAAKAADEAVEDAVGALLNALSNLDTTTRSARIAVEAGFLSAAQSQADCLRSMVELEKACLNKRLEELKKWEAEVNEIDVRADLCQCIEEDTKDPERRSLVREDDDGGVASALAVLNSHREPAGGMAAVENAIGNVVLEGWGSKDETGIVSREEIDNMIKYLFANKPNSNDEIEQNMDESKNHNDDIPKTLQGIVDFVIDAVKDQSNMSRIHRAMVCSSLNKQRGIQTEMKYEDNFNGLCDILKSLLSGCGRQTDDIDNAKMCMILAQTFYRIGGVHDDASSTNGENETFKIDDRGNRIYVKEMLKDHPIWSDEHFWDQALFRCTSDALTKSCVLRSFQLDTEEDKALEWHDLDPNQRLEAAAQVHAVISAQIGALAHSMVEFGCGTEGACAFVRRMSIRHQLPISKRALLLQHLVSRNGKKGYE